MNRHWSTMLVAGSLAALASCGGGDSPLEPGRSDLAIARAKWVAQRPQPYAYTVRKLCFCAITGQVRVYVQGDTVVGAVALDDGGQPIDKRYVESIEGLFDFIDRAITNHAAVVRATYDPVLGYPTSIVYDGAANVADDEVSYTLTDVKPAYFTVSR